MTLLGRKCQGVLIRTFLGHELQLGRRRITCPDMTTARYLRVFAELGMKAIQIPYDPTQTASLLSELEDSYASLQKAIEMTAGGKSDLKGRTRRVYGRIRAELANCEAEILDS